jgi:hypothetical protein
VAAAAAAAVVAAAASVVATSVSVAAAVRVVAATVVSVRIVGGVSDLGGSGGGGLIIRLLPAALAVTDARSSIASRRELGQARARVSASVVTAAARPIAGACTGATTTRA